MLKDHAHPRVQLLCRSGDAAVALHRLAEHEDLAWGGPIPSGISGSASETCKAWTRRFGLIHLHCNG
jgi:hypothetical protein